MWMIFLRTGCALWDPELRERDTPYREKMRSLGIPDSWAEDLGARIRLLATTLPDTTYLPLQVTAMGQHIRSMLDKSGTISDKKGGSQAPCTGAWYAKKRAIAATAGTGTGKTYIFQGLIALAAAGSCRQGARWPARKLYERDAVGLLEKLCSVDTKRLDITSSMYSVPYTRTRRNA